ncbi:outer membrane beta-barrel protein [Vibrio panuliri]|uniref:Capsular biosynthesis protein CpsB n=1 Tax=Vibrio panuliri TaxID=1381081 RepID=A0A1Q9HMX4_9VIBR|nr:outer membrane beta-barrel protein [Vibrio panuliri]KAB1457237.1 outer membrane beta-barrel protein [Vibrio panuliri]OLQ92102.1 capsular biosynthesis protein CpsB [Vibrio panuliri]OLQ92511.1 capsular biosynthesis protein CpsB [Vibrio panuliri]
MRGLSYGVIAIIGGLISVPAIANKSDGYITESGLKIVPLLDSNLEHVDNIGRFSDAEDPQSSTVFIIEPGVALQSDRNGNTYQLAYQLSSGTYFDSSDDNFIDHRLTSNNFIQLSRRHGVGLNYTFLNLHEERGSGLLAGDSLSTIADEPVKYSLHNLSATYVFGSKGAKGQIESNIRYENKRFKNYRDITLIGLTQVSTRYKDYDELGGGIAFYYRVSPVTQLLAEIDVADREYKLNDPETGRSQDNFDAYYYLGARWEMTGKTEGRLRVGLQDKSYQDSTKKDFDGLSWDLSLRWQPVDYSTVTLDGSLKAIDANQGFDSVDQTNISASWKHFWSSNYYTNSSIGLMMDDYSESSREDDLLKADLSIGYEIIDYVDLSSGWRYENNNSTINGNTYDQNVWYISANVIF